MPAQRKRKAEASTTVDENCPAVAMFRQYQLELDTKHDKHERLVKLSRDVTIESKRTIFLLQRLTGSSPDIKILEEALEKLKAIENTKLLSIAKELDQEDPYKFLRAYSPGLQEYIEAVSFYHYLKNKKLVTLEEVQKDLTFKSTCSSVDGIDNELSQLTTQKVENGNSEKTKIPDTQCKVICNESEMDKELREVQVHVPPTEYFLGLADLTGELMRLAVGSVGKGDLDTPFQVRDFLQLMQSGFVSFGNCGREIGRKLSTLRQSLQKVETACYTLQVRGSEIPKHMLVDVLSSGPSDYGSNFDNDMAANDD
ncbi:translin-associated protein X-like [Mytilus edulis]|uniref:Translin-associated protein X n=1 Tax=Mytilus edulis TaxID=6550 RepID=A0A8S3TY69_MYTED|nr:Translin-associated protein X [Mytilus edulis]